MGDLLPQYIRTFRRTAGLSQREVAQLVGVDDRSLVSRLEQGERLPTVDIAFALALGLGTSVDALYAGIKGSVEAQVRQRAARLLEHLDGDPEAIASKRVHLAEIAGVDDPIMVPLWDAEANV